MAGLFQHSLSEKGPGFESRGARFFTKRFDTDSNKGQQPLIDAQPGLLRHVLHGRPPRHLTELHNRLRNRSAGLQLPVCSLRILSYTAFIIVRSSICRALARASALGAKLVKDLAQFGQVSPPHLS